MENTVATGLESERLTTHLSWAQPIERDRNWGAHTSRFSYNLESLGFGPGTRPQHPMPNGNYSGHRYDQFCPNKDDIVAERPDGGHSGMHVPQYSAKMPTTKATFRLPALFDVVVPVSRRPCIRAFLI